MNLIEYSTSDILQLYRDSFFAEFGTPMIIGSDNFTSAAVETYVLGVLVNALNQANNQRFLETATGTWLDAIAGVNGLSRPSPKSASAAFLVNVVSQGITIPTQALKVTNGDLVFTNLEPVYMNILNKNVLLYCTETGTKGNGYPVNSINEILSGGAYVSSAYNISATGGGFDGFPYDEAGDNGFREYIKNTRSAYVCGGSAPAYRAKALEQDTRIIDVYVAKDGDSVYEKGKAKIYTLYDFDEVNSYARNLINDKVYEACSSDSFRPIGDYVEVNTATQNLFQLSSSFKLKYPLAFRDVCVGHFNQIFKEYRKYLYSGFKRPFSESELAKRLITPDENGVYALSFDYTGSQAQWVLPSENTVYLLTWLYMNNYQTKTYSDYINAGVLELIDTGV